MSRTDANLRLDYYMRLAEKTILNNVDPVTGLFASTLSNMTDHAWVRDNVYAVHAIWGLSLAYHKRTELDEDRCKAYELDQICVKVMRSILMCMMRQSDKVEAFKESQLPKDSLHAKYSARNWSAVVGDLAWGHLQIDATSLYLLTLAQLTASGRQIIFTLDEVAFIQNLVFYIENAYCIADYGVWERGDKTNHGLPELNASSIGMAKAALQALNDLDLFGAKGSQASVIHVLPDEMQQCQAVLQSMLPRESYSKEIDAGLLSIISYPAFAVEDAKLIQTTRTAIVEKLRGVYGCRRFLRDGYKTAREDPNRLYYEPSELQKFENLECEWPLFFCYFILDGLFSNNFEEAAEYRQLLEKVLIQKEDDVKMVPELYTVPADKVELELAEPHSQIRVPAGMTPFLWAQSLYILGCLVEEKYIQAAELDPLNRRLCTEKRPDVVVQVVVLAEDAETKQLLSKHNIHVDTVEDVQPFVVQPASVLGKIYSQLGKSNRLNLSGRPSSREVGLLSTSKLYMIDDRIFAFTPKFIDWQRFYLTYDTNILVDTTKSELFYVKSSWNVPGRPLVVLSLSKAMLMGRTPNLPGTQTPGQGQGQGQPGELSPPDQSKKSPAAGGGGGSPLGLIGTIKKLKSGYLSGTRIIMGRIHDFLTTSCITKLNFLSFDDETVDHDVRSYLDELLSPMDLPRARLPSGSGAGGQGAFGWTGAGFYARRMSTDHQAKMTLVRGLAVQRRKSVFVDASGDDAALRRLRAKYSSALGYVSPFASSASMIPSPNPEPASPPNYDDLTPGAGGFQLSFAYPPGSAAFQSLAGRGGGGGGGGSESDATPTPTRAQSPPYGGDQDSTISGGVCERRDSINLATLRLNEIALEAPRNEMDLEDVDCEDLVEMLYETDRLEEQADILQYLWIKKGPTWDTELGGKKNSPVRGLVEELYQKACNAQMWWLVRLSAGLLGKRVEDSAKAVTDLLVRQKQITVGMPAIHEETIIYPLSVEQLQKTVKSAFVDDNSSAMLTLEILVYLGMFVRTEPRLFSEMLRLRVGLILQVMASEFARALHCTGEEASQHLLNLSPYEMKTLLHHILSGKEFGEVDEGTRDLITHTERTKAERTGCLQLRQTLTKHKVSMIGTQLVEAVPAEQTAAGGDQSKAAAGRSTSFGQWVRRRRIDGALNRVPPDFYSKIWHVLHKFEALSVEGHILHHNLTKEMTTHEIKFALSVESVLNRIPDPEYRQLLVEAMMVLTLLADKSQQIDMRQFHWPTVMYVERIVFEANEIFLSDQKQQKGDATECCAHDPPTKCDTVANVCKFFYDSPPSGRYGTITYMCRALVKLLLPQNEELECAIS